MSGLTDPMWLARARDLIGLHEIKGEQHEAKILQLARDAHVGWIRDDETAWCAIFACAMLERSLLTSTRSAAARSFERWGLDVKSNGIVSIPVGAILVWSRPPNPTQGHVNFAVGLTPNGNILGLGGNQADAVSIAAFKPERLVAARWPSEAHDDLRLMKLLPVLDAGAKVSTNEA